MFSIVIATWNNPVQLSQCVGSIRENSYFGDHQIIIVHDDNTFNGVGGHTDYDHKDIYVNEHCGLSHCANLGTMSATKDFICLIDDDITVTKNWDLNLAQAHATYENNWVASTRIEPHPCPTNYREDKNIRKIFYRNISNTPLLIPTKFWKKIGGYDEDFPTIGAELGLAKRAYDAGERLFVQTPFSIVHHLESQSTGRLKNIKQLRKQRDETFLRKYGITRKEFTSKHVQKYGVV